MKFSLIIPCYNEARNLPLLLDRCKEVTRRPDVEVVLVDNGSTDNTHEVLDALLANCERCRSVRVACNRGYGHGILFGLAAATGDILGWTHADLQTDPIDSLRGLELFEMHGPAIFVKGLRYGRRLPEVAFTVGMSAFETVLLGQRMWDINAQPTMFSRAFFDSWRAPPHDFALDLYAYYQACQAGLPVSRFPVYFGNRAHGVSHWNVNWAAKLKFIRRTVNFSMTLKKTMKA